MTPDFTTLLMEWNKGSNSRQMPWKGERDPYKIWLSEVILQQTRVEQGWKYYELFINTFPTITQLAAAKEETVFKLWEGLGYYSRCRNLIETAKRITLEYKGIFPDDYNKIRDLKGIGPYTAAAIASFAFDQPVAVVDGNVQRIIARYFGISTPTDSPAGKKLFNDLATALLDTEQPALFNQAIMDFGATVCKPVNPLCEICIQRNDCEAFKHGFVSTLPMKQKALKKTSRWFYYFIIDTGHYILVRKRTEKDIWQNLHEFVLLETDEPIEDQSTFYEFLQSKFGREFIITNVSKLFRQQLTHQTIQGKFIEVRLSEDAPITGYQKLTRKQFAKLAFPGFINAYLRSKNPHSSLPGKFPKS